MFSVWALVSLVLFTLRTLWLVCWITSSRSTMFHFPLLYLQLRGHRWIAGLLGQLMVWNHCIVGQWQWYATAEGDFWLAAMLTWDIMAECQGIISRHLLQTISRSNPCVAENAWRPIHSFPHVVFAFQWCLVRCVSTLVVWTWLALSQFELCGLVRVSLVKFPRRPRDRILPLSLSPRALALVLVAVT